MNTKMLIASAAIAVTAALGTASAAHADPHFGFSIGIGTTGFDHGPFWGDRFYHPHPNYGFYDEQYLAPPPPPPVVVNYGIGCGVGANIVRGSGFRGVQAVDCRAPVYTYEGFKRGRAFDVSVNTRGQIVQVTPLY